MVQHARDGLGRQARRDGLHRQPEAHDALFVIPAAQQHLVVRHFAAVDLARVAVEAEVADPVLAAGIGAAADLDGEPAHAAGRRTGARVSASAAPRFMVLVSARLQE